MKKYLRVYVVACLPLFFLGCKKEMPLSDTQLWNGERIHAEVVRIKPYQEDGKEKSLVYGSLVFENDHPAGVKVNLTCVAISLEDVSSEHIYVDSVAHILPDSYLIDTGRTQVPVYWKIDKRFDAGLERKKFKLLISPGCKLIDAQGQVENKSGAPSQY